MQLVEVLSNRVDVVVWLGGLQHNLGSPTLEISKVSAMESTNILSRGDVAMEGHILHIHYMHIYSGLTNQKKIIM